ncbi:MAG: hypothetical protein QOC82_3198 [Frankiaceae bacterium]|jgi:hypothetical protein|nr:hypothetical protein [Frankiaceae bacterium]
MPDSVSTRQQLLAAGVTVATLRANLAAGRWRALNERVVCLHNGPLTESQRRWAVYLSAAQPAAMCGRTAMTMWGVAGYDDGRVHVLVRRGARVLPVPGVDLAVHESRRFAATDIVYGRAPDLTSLARATVDAATWCSAARDAARLLVAPVQQRLERPANLLRELQATGRVRHRGVLLSLCRDLVGGAQALSEVEFLAFCRRHGLPRPELQVRLDSAGRRRYLDAAFRLADGRMVRVEVDGGVHLTLTTRWLDTVKDNDAALSGQLVLRFPSVALYLDDPRAVQQLRRALGLVSG